MTPPLGNPVTLTHAQVGGISGIVCPSTDGETYFYDWSAKEKYPVNECPTITVVGPVAPQMVPCILEQMRDATIVHLR